MRLHSIGVTTGGVVAGRGDVLAIKECGWHSHDSRNWETRMNRLVASWVPGCLLMIPIAGAAAAPTAAAGPPAAAGPTVAVDAAQPATTLETIVVTGSYI